MATKRVAPMRASISATLKGTTVPVIPRSQVRYSTRYTVQEQAPAGNWVDNFGCNDWNMAVSMADQDQRCGRKTRIVDNGDPE